MFPFSGTFYYPKPDHTPADRVSLAWAGTRSENLASVWLLYHLLDELGDDRLAAIAAATDLAMRPSEDRKAYRARLMDAGILGTPDRVDEALFNRSKRDLLAQLPQTAHPEDEVALKTLNYGWGYAAERKRVGATAKRALEADWRRVDGRIDRCVEQHGALVSAFARRAIPAASTVRDLSVRFRDDGIDVACGRVPEGYSRPDAAYLAGRRLPVPEAPSGLFSWGHRSRRSGLPEASDLQIDGLHLSTLAPLRDAMAQHREAVSALPERPDPYDPRYLHHHGDFRVLLAMRYVAALAADYGVRSDLKQVLSLPLGASEITLEEATVLYEGLVTGTAHAFGGTTADGPTQDLQTATSLIREIHDAEGRIIYRSDLRTNEITSPRIGALTTDILRNVVQHGTGVRAKRAVMAGGHPVPVGGKTGTTNGFRNAAFIGYVPRSDEGGYRAPAGYVIGTYVGYDDNRPMVNGGIRLSGASGALPAWIGTAQGLANAGLIGSAPATITTLEAGKTWPLVTDGGFGAVRVDTKTGLPITEDDLVVAEGEKPPETGTVLVRASRVASRSASDRGRARERAGSGSGAGTSGWWERLKERLSGR